MNKIKTLFIASLMLVALAACQLTPQTVWIDVRTVEEYQQDHIDDTANIPHLEITDRIDSLNLRKSTPIKLYCRSGVRAGLALTALEELGYTNVENVGGIADARALLESE